MKVHLLLEVDSWDRSSVLGVFFDTTKAKEAAEKKEPDRPFHWVERIDGWYVHESTFNGPIYSYEVQEMDVIE